jgi:hypothetical protein
MFFLITKVLVSGGLIVAVSELAKRNNTAASIVHSLLALVGLYYDDTHDTALIARHAHGTFWFVLPTLPLFLVLPWLLRRDSSFSPSLSIGVAFTVALYFLTLRLLKAAGIVL